MCSVNFPGFGSRLEGVTDPAYILGLKELADTIMLSIMFDIGAFSYVCFLISFLIWHTLTNLIRGFSASL